MTLLQLLKLFVPQLSDTLTLISLYGSIVLALLTCFFGFRLRHAWYALLVLAIAGLIGFSVSTAFWPDRLGLCLLLGLGFGLLVSAFTFRLYQLAMFVVAFFCVFAMVGEVFGDAFPLASGICAVFLGIMGGILAAKFQYRVVILITAVTGGWRAASALRRVVPSMPPQTMLILAAVLILAGCIVQFSTTKKLAR